MTIGNDVALNMGDSLAVHINDETATAATLWIAFHEHVARIVIDRKGWEEPYVLAIPLIPTIQFQ